ncbi:acetyl-coenzyme A carboxylase carboxyl transferase subunit alpha, chloroplastic [Gastrolobium bilobum]|uniref:acetyl-coenzyme A carboxylase carboxyl transferase subunit alpha, chloroplastic n=1 Tax=Gastrolobium bilobum TaxID=150636 RepID=UPI002AB2E91A|nr:acetyl-coenzyme A carboxylase carboxyl transferase subunit alpha, chloroplastic [Gastrolobium bilobum]XP_061339628.1 acetyl-coenzyme A carboxylase carboxyl transferase subunit alpha, chloroplastic [Gastrolobium bilobum]
MAAASASLGGVSASDLLRSSTSGFSGVPLRTLGRARLVLKRRDLTVSAKLRKVKKHEYPWPDNPDPNVKGGVLSHLSPFKPLKEKPKPVTLDFEKPLVALQKKIIDVRKMANETGLDFSDQILSLEDKYQQALKDLYTHLTPIQRVQIARHPNRPTFLDHVFNITEKFMELHGDRAGYDDPAIVTGIGTIDGRRYMFIGHQKGRNTKENIQRNFGMPTPHGYRKALRLMEYADHHGFPIVTFIDTPGAYADLKSEELGQGEAIAHNLRSMFGLKVPIVSIVIGEGGSGGALAIGCANKLLMLENAVFYVASPEACAAILWKSAKAAPKAAEKLKITAPELCKLQIADGVIPEPLGGAHADPNWTSKQIKIAINEAMDELTQMKTEDLLRHRTLKFRKIGGFQEGIPLDPKKTANMKKRDVPVAKEIPDAHLGVEVEKLKQKILEAQKSSSKPPKLELDEMIKKLKRDVHQEYSEAVKAMGLTDEVSKLREEVSKAKSDNQPIDPLLMDKIEKLEAEFEQGLSAAPNYGRLQNKLDFLKELLKVKSLSDKNEKAATFKQEFKTKYDDILNNPRIKEKNEAIKAEIQAVGASSLSDLDDELKKKIIEFKEEVDLELANALKSAGYDVEIVEPKGSSVSEYESKIEELNKDIKKEMETLVNSSDIKDKIKLLKLEIAMAGETPDLESKNRIAALEQQIKQSLVEALDSSSLKEEYENLVSKISSELDGSLKKEDPEGDNPTNDDLRMKVGANRTFT